MKILVLSLLRLGDILLHKQLLAPMMQKYPKAQIDFVINDNFASAQSILSGINRVHLLPRTILQKILVEQEQSPMAAYEKLKNFTDVINAENYDLILDATHNKLSVKLCGILEAKEIRFAKSQKAVTNLWESYFNNQFSQLNQSRFHYVDVLAKSLELPAPEALLPKISEGKTVVFQVLTSDEKKNWGLERFKHLIDKVQSQHPDNHCLVACAPNELAEIEKVMPRTLYDVRSLSLDQVKVELSSAALLVSGDTSIHHLAAEVGCPVISIFIGSADAIKTAPYIKNALILQASSPCYPCKHSEKCHQLTHICSSSISIEQVYNNIEISLKGESMSRYQEQQTLRTGADQHGFMLTAVNQSEKSLAADFERIVWSFYLSEEWKAPVPFYGSAVFEILNDWNHRYSMKAISQFATHQQVRVEKIENAIFEGKQELSALSKACLSGTANTADVNQVIQQLQKWHSDLEMDFSDVSDSFLKMKFALHKAYQDSFSVYRELKNSLEEPLNLNLIRKQLLINLIRSLSEKGELNEREFGILS